MDFHLESILAVMVPIIAIVMGIGLAMLAVWVRHQSKREMFELHHKERLLAIERGMEVPPLPPEFFKDGLDRGSDRMRQGLVWLFVGMALIVALALNKSLETAAWGLIPFAVGIANLIYHFAVGRRQTENSSQPSDH